jgi:hypothetical protein
MSEEVAQPIDAAMAFWTEGEEAAQDRRLKEAVEFWTPDPTCKECGGDMILSKDDPLAHYEGEGVCMICQIAE